MKQHIMPLVLIAALSGFLSCKPSSQDSRTYGAGGALTHVMGDATGKKGTGTEGTVTPSPNPGQGNQTGQGNQGNPSPGPATPSTPATNPTNGQQPPASPTQVVKVVQSFVGGQFKKVDLVITFDESGSMEKFRSKLENNLHVFINELLKKGLDLNIVILADKFTVPADVANVVTFIPRPVGSYEGIRYLKEFYTSIKRVRENSNLEAIVITDDDAAGAGQMAPDFKPTYSDGRVIRVNAIIEPLRVDQNNKVLPSPCGSMRYGQQYVLLQAASGGIVIDICSDDWTALITKIANNMATVNQSYPLTDTPDTNATITVAINQKPLQPSQFTIDAAAKTVKINDTALLTEGVVVEITYFKK